MSDEFISILKEELQRSLEEEVYGKASMAQAIPMVDVECGFGMDEEGRRTTIRVVERPAPLYLSAVPEVIEIEMNGDRYMVRRDGPDFDFFDEDHVIEMRARWLLIRDAYYTRLHSMSNSFRDIAVERFFYGSVWTPEPGSSMARSMGFTQE